MKDNRRRHVPASAAILALAILVSGCITYVVPVDSWEAGSLHSVDFENLLGKSKREVSAQIGEPDYVLSSRELREIYYLYERDRFAETEAGHYYLEECRLIPCGIDGSSGRTTTKTGKSCYLVAFDAKDTLVRYETDWIRRVSEGRSENRPSSAEQNAPGQPLRTTPYLDCREFYWSKEDLLEMTSTDSATYLEELASAGSATAAIDFAMTTGNPKYLGGDDAFNLYKSFSTERKTVRQAWSMLCHAANGGHGRSQQEVGTWHRASMWNSGDNERLTWLRADLGIGPDNRVAFMWYTLADKHGDQSGLWLRGFVETDMTAEQISQAEQMVHEWKPGDCPSAEHRLASPDDR